MSQFSVISHAFQDPRFHRPASRCNPGLNKSPGVSACLGGYPNSRASRARLTSKSFYEVPKESIDTSYDDLCTNCVNRQLSVHKEHAKRKEKEESIIKEQELSKKFQEQEQEKELTKSAEKKKWTEAYREESLRTKAKKVSQAEQGKESMKKERLNVEAAFERQKRINAERQAETVKRKIDYRNELISQIQTKEAVKKSARDKPEDNAGLAIGYSKDNALERLRKQCVEYNKKIIREKELSRSPLRKQHETVEAAPTKSTKYIEATKKAKEERENLQRYYKSEFNQKEAGRRLQLDEKKVEKIGMDQRLSVIQVELEMEKKRALENQAEIRRILTSQIEAKNQKKIKEKEDDKVYSKYAEPKGTPDKVSARYKQCKQCKSPIK